MNTWKCDSHESWTAFIQNCYQLQQAGEKRTFRIQNPKHRSVDQNDMKEFQVTEIAKHCHGGNERDARRQIKLEVGVPILRRDNEDFKAMYDRIVKPHDYETKLEIMDWLPVTSTMTVTQMKECIENTFDHFASVVPWPVRNT